MNYLEQKYKESLQIKHEYYAMLYDAAYQLWDYPKISLSEIRDLLYKQTNDYYLHKGNLDELLTCARDGLCYHGPNGWIKPPK